MEWAFIGSAMTLRYGCTRHALGLKWACDESSGICLASSLQQLPWTNFCDLLRFAKSLTQWVPKHNPRGSSKYLKDTWEYRMVSYLRNTWGALEKCVEGCV